VAVQGQGSSESDLDACIARRIHGASLLRERHQEEPTHGIFFSLFLPQTSMNLQNSI
jgi:hypothetical protein